MSFSTRLTPIPLKNTDLFKPVKIGSIELDHRVVLAPLTRFRNDDAGVPTEIMAEYYSQRSSRPGTLIITEATFISKQAGGYPHAPGIWSKDQVEGWKKVHEAVHKNKSYSFQQLWAIGRQSNPEQLKKEGSPFVSASDIYMDDASKKAALEAGNELRALSKDEIKQYIKDYVTAAKNSLEAGADGVELHSANGYLLNQFLDSLSNKRTDEYGGSIENRARFTLEVVDALIEAVGADKVGIRLSPFGTFGTMSGTSDPLYLSVYAYVVGQLELRAQKGNRLAYIHVVEPRVANLAFQEGEGISDGSSDFIYDIWKGPVIRAGDYALNPKLAAEHASKGSTLIAYGRMFIANPDLPDRLYNGWDLNEYNRGTFYSPGPVGYTDLPTYEEAKKQQE